MNNVLRAPNGVRCRACGAVAAPPARTDAVPSGICRFCENRFVYWRDHRLRKNAVTFEMWLATRLESQLKRALRTGGIVGCCEAITYNSFIQARLGYQCGMDACEIVDGRKVCKIHARSRTGLTFVGESTAKPWAIISDSLYAIGSKDDAFRDMLLTVTALLEQKKILP